MSVMIIAELGINFNGDLELLKHMAMAAKLSGADYVKIQKREIDYCYSPEQLETPCESPWGTTVRDKVEGRELSWEQLDEFDGFCVKNEIAWFASAFDLMSLSNLNQQYSKMPFNKIPSALAVRPEYVDAVVKYRRPTLISTGLCKDIAEICEIAEKFERGKCRYIINHCVALYPCPSDRLNLKLITRLQTTIKSRSFGWCHGVGYSGHEVGLLPSVIAARMGATHIERHFTLDRSMYGADQAASVEPQGFRRLVRDIRELDVIMGDGVKALVGDEKNPVTFWREP